jgi:Reverse transcriptase (RNA-dependent DNA polymerase)
MDLQSGYWQVPIKEADRPKTAFLTADGLYQFKVMAMGLCSAPGAFQRMMDVVLSGLKWTTCLVYLDDIIVYSRLFEEHVNRLRMVSDRLQSANLIVKLETCEFTRPTLKALGHIVDKHGISPDPEKIRAVRDFPRPPLEGSNAKK